MSNKISMIEYSYTELGGVAMPRCISVSSDFTDHANTQANNSFEKYRLKGSFQVIKTY